jgi:hypothetical protein
VLRRLSSDCLIAAMVLLEVSFEISFVEITNCYDVILSLARSLRLSAFVRLPELPFPVSRGVKLVSVLASGASYDWA